MVHGYHVIMGAYGFWLPNDPRGSWSDFVGAWELVHFGRATRSADRKAVLTDEEQELRRKAKLTLKRPPVRFTGIQARAVGRGFATSCRKSMFTIWACSILSEHVHLVIARHRYKVEQVVNLLKGQATRYLTKEGLHPQALFARNGQRPPSPWARGHWKEYLDTEDAIENAIHYVEDNPVKEGKPVQRWRFVTPFSGLDHGVVSYH